MATTCLPGLRNWMRASLALSALATLGPGSAHAQVVRYYHVDTLGSVRATTAQNGTVIERHDYLPFGEECVTGPCAGNPAGSQPRRFTGHERDSETGLDYFGARYYGQRNGRFTSVDPIIMKVTLIDSQQWNRYAYARNNPLRYTDPTGLYVFDPSVDDKQKKRFRNALAAAKKSAGNLKGSERQDLDESLAAYGDEGVDNGVTVSFREGLSGAETGPNAVPFIYDAAANAFTASFTSVFGDGLGGDEMTIAVAHEGRHLADAQGYAGAMTGEARGGGAARNSIANRTRYDQEFRGYTVSALTAKALGHSALRYDRFEIWSDRMGIQPAQLNNYLATSPTYRLTPQSPGRRYSP